jgi:proline dehydrogenase
MLRNAIRMLGGSRTARLVVTRTPLRGMSRRFVPGETVEDLLRAVRRASEAGLRTTSNYLGEHVSEESQATRASEVYASVLDRLANERIEPNVSVKLTQLGQDISDGVLEASLLRVLEHARAADGFVRLDMESSTHTTRTLDLAVRLREQGWANVGVVLQASLRRTPDDVVRMNALGIRVRLCKGAYLEPERVAYQDKADVDRAYMELTRRLLSGGTYPAIATHDEHMIDAALEFAGREGIARDAFEFQMLYGVRRDLQRRLAADGWRVRVYIPFGEQWYPYLMRRLAERPANLLFLAGSVVRESPLGFLWPRRKRR